MLCERNGYRMCDTGQGFNRLQSCPRVSREMSAILQRVQQQCGAWVGLSVGHLGDRDVPNALMVIDKYNQLARILHPIVHTVDSLGPLVEEVSSAAATRARCLPGARLVTCAHPCL